ncbi:MAG: hypothetical protein Q4D16_10470 [Eubacteriales bacterium]|nr:hypothetical protein [Eubacteriales bacterium]
MDLFESPGKKIKRRLRRLFPVFLLVILCCIFLKGIDRTSEETLLNEQATLKQALEKGAVHTYALTGRYPENLSCLLDEYQITYDPDKFIVEYIPNGSNLFPMISVLPLSKGKGGSS